MADQPSRRQELAAIAASLRGHLAWQEAESGRSILRPIGAKPAAAPADPPRPRTQPPKAQGIPARAVAPPPPAAAPAAAPVAAAAPAPYQPKAVTLDELRQEHLDCQRCKLCQGRSNLVFGTGSPLAEVVFVGEAPGEEEDKQGVPFVGKAGQLLTKMIEAMGYRRDEVYICNVVKCRPPGNRNPEADEIAACEPFLKAQLRMIHPKVIVALGKFAAQTLLRDSTAISKMRGHWREYEGVALMPTFHPAYLLRSPAEKKLAWGDLLKVMALLGKKPPVKGRAP
ncbi:MAG: uracil-DNA glycosylase [Myxococcaceae bacterium]